MLCEDFSSRDNSGRDQQLIIPFDKSVNLVAKSFFFKLADSSRTSVRQQCSGRGSG